MADTRTLPHVRQSLVDQGGSATQPWFAWFQRINDAVTSGAIGTEAADASIAAIATALGATDGTVATIPPLDFSNTLSGDTLALGLRSVRHYGSLASGQVSFDLVGDEDAPGNTYAYGTAGDGTKGWRSIASAFTTPGNISLTVGADGVTAVDLADLANAGGGTLQKTNRDAKGRLAGTSAATTTDLTEGTNLYHTAARVLATVLAGLSTATATAVTAADTVLAAIGKLQAQITAKVVPKGYIDGLQMQWVSGTALTVSSGSAYIEASANIVAASSAIAKAGLALSASTWYHVYLYLNAGTPDVEIVTTAPATAYSGTARSKTGDTTRRYVGSVLTNASSNLYNFVAGAGGAVNYNESASGAPFRLIVNGTATVKTTVSAAAVMPVTARLAVIRVSNNGTTVLSIGNPADGLSAYPLIVTIAPSAILGASFLTDSSQALSYIFSSAGGPGGIVADLFGYVYER